MVNWGGIVSPYTRTCVRAILLFDSFTTVSGKPAPSAAS